MISLLTLPKLDYIIFELLQFGSEYGRRDLDNSAKSLGIVVMDVQPTSIDYDYGSKKNYIAGQGDTNIRTFKGGLAPIKVGFNGTFGRRTITRGIYGRNGDERLKEFIQLFRNSQGINRKERLETSEKTNYSYGLNYYDFTNHIWGCADLDRFKVLCDSRTSTQVPSYSLSFTIMGDLINTSNKSDPLLRNLQLVIKAENILDTANLDMIDNLNNNAPILNEIMADLEVANVLLNEAISMSTNYLYDSIDMWKKEVGGTVLTVTKGLNQKYLGDVL